MQRDLIDSHAIQAQAKRDADRLREWYRHRGRKQATGGEPSPAQVREYLKALRELLGEPAP
jgi:hypothetical protein